MKVCTQAGLRRREKRFVRPSRAERKVERRDGEGLREPEDEGEEGGEGRVRPGVLWCLERGARPDSRI